MVHHESKQKLLRGFAPHAPTFSLTLSLRSFGFYIVSSALYWVESFLWLVTGHVKARLNNPYLQARTPRSLDSFSRLPSSFKLSASRALPYACSGAYIFCCYYVCVIAQRSSQPQLSGVRHFVLTEPSSYPFPQTLLTSHRAPTLPSRSPAPPPPPS